VRRHQFGGDRERCRERKTDAEAGEHADDDQLRAGLRQRYQQGERRAGDDADLHHGLAADAVGHGGGDEGADHDDERGRDSEPANLFGGQVQRLFCQHQQRAAECQVVALDEADRPEDEDQLQVVDTERNAVELAPEQEAGRARGGRGRKGFRHGVLPDGQPRERPLRQSAKPVRLFSNNFLGSCSALHCGRRTTALAG
jgi:hypothetical protein